MLEAVVTIALIGVLAGLVISQYGGNIPQTARDSRMEADVAHLNQAVALYLADGGSLDTATTEQAVLDRLKRVRPDSEAKTNVGVTSGRLIDVRLRARTGAGSLSTNQKYRASWNGVKKRFELKSDGAAGVDEFYLDDALADAQFPLDTRSASKVKFNASNGWVWGNVGPDSKPTYVTPTTTNQTNQSNGFDPTTELPSGGGSGSGGSGSGGSGSGGSGGGGSGSGSGGPTAPSVLPTPVITPAGGTFAYAAFPSSVSIDNGGAPGGVSTLMYRLNGGSWNTYSSPLTIASGDKVEAKNVTTSLSHSDSSTAAQTYYRLVAGFAGTSSGSWNTVTGGSTLQYEITPGDPTTSVSHGNTKLDLGNGEVLDAGVPNVLTYTKNEFTGITPNTAFTLGELSLLNGTTFYDSEASSVTLTLDLNFTSPPLNRTVNVKFNLVNTDNSADRLASADIVEIANPEPLSLTLDGVTYTLKLQWVTLDPGAGVVQGTKFLVFEGASALAQLRATLVANH